ncbi:ATP-binding protein [Methylomagnum sp.]
MSAPAKDCGSLLLQVHDLTLQLEEVREALRAIRMGEVDAVVVRSGDQERIFTLKDADQIYRCLIEAMSEGALVLDPGHIILYCNRRFADMVGTPLEKVIGAPLGGFIAPSDAGPFSRLFEAGCRHGHSRGDLSLTGEVRVLVSISRIPSEDVEGACVALVTDISALRETQAALEKARDELESKVADRTHELLEANAILAEADQRKDEFLAMLAHELRNPLAPIRTATQVLKLKSAGITEMQVPLSMIERQAQHLARLVDDLLDASRLAQGKITLKRRPVDLAPIIAQVVENHRPVAEQQRHALTLSLPSHPLRVDGDEVRLTQVFSNLVNNAIKYTPSGGRISITVRDNGSEADIAVRDNGIGLAQKELPHIFGLFAQVTQGLDRSYGGLGIGLSLVKSLTEMHGGRVEAHSAGLDQGSEFIIHLPLLPAQTNRAENLSPTPSPPAPPRHDLRLLVVDDNHDAAESMAELLVLEGYTTRMAHDGFTAMETYRDYAPNVVVLDIGLPEIDGFEVARRIREERDEPAPTLIAMTGYGQSGHRERALSDGLFDHYLVKPVCVDVLLGLLDALKSGGAAQARGIVGRALARPDRPA